jgi:hypothetical protein
MKQLIIALGICITVAVMFAFVQHRVVPETWDMNAIKRFHLPPPDTTVKVTYAPKAYYDSLPEHIIYNTYPVYYREFEKPGYLDSLRGLKPEIAFDPSQLKTKEDWIKAGELVFNWPVAYTPIKDKVSRAVAAESTGRIPEDGVYHFNRYVLDKDQGLMVGSLSCASCHTQVLASGKVAPGAPGNVYNAAAFANAVRTGRIPFPVLQAGAKDLSFAPWAPSSLQAMPNTAEQFADNLQAAPHGVIDRQGSAYFFPVPVPNLFGIKDIRYFDRTGLMKHENPGDLMRYAAFNQGMDMLTSYNGYIPGGKNSNSELPAAKEWRHPFAYVGKRYTDEQLYALTQYIYSLTPPENPNRFRKKLVSKGELIFKKAGCVSCHTPPLYTNNKLTPVNGFEPPASHFKKYDIFNVSVETDSISALYSRRGTGYYKVPSLRNLWLQTAFFHNGSLSSLEEVFNPKRLQPDYVPHGYKPPHLATMPVKGHPFGLELSEEDKEALIAFLKTL